MGEYQSLIKYFLMKFLKMRIKSAGKFYERKSQIHEPKSKHFIIFEGIRTEQIYFDSYLKKNEKITNIFFLLRDKDKEGWSNPQKIMELLVNLINGYEHICFTYETIFENIFEYIHQHITAITKKKMKNRYINNLIQNGVKLQDPVDTNKLDTIVKAFIGNYIQQYSIHNVIYDETTLREIIEEQSTFDKSIDKISLANIFSC